MGMNVDEKARATRPMLIFLALMCPSGENRGEDTVGRILPEAGEVAREKTPLRAWRGWISFHIPEGLDAMHLRKCNSWNEMKDKLAVTASRSWNALSINHAEAGTAFLTA